MIEKKNIEDYNEEDLYIYNKDIIISNLVVEYNELVDLYNELLKENEEQQERIDKALDKLYCWGEALYPEFQKGMLDILKGGNNE